MKYRLLYSETSRKQVKELHPQIKPHIKTKLEQIAENPYIGKHLERELSGYLSYRAKRYRIVFKIRENEKFIEVHHVGPRRDIYELFGDEIRARENR